MKINRSKRQWASSLFFWKNFRYRSWFLLFLMPWFKYSNGTFFKVRIRTFWSSHSSTLTRLLTDFGRIFFKILLVGSFSFGIFLWLLLLSQQTFVGLQDVLKTSSIRLQLNNSTSSKTSWRGIAKTSWRRLEDVLQRRLEDVLKTFWRPLPRRLEDIFKTSWKTKKCYAEDVLKMSWRHVLKTCLEDMS